MIFLIVFLIMLAITYSLYFLGVDAVVTMANLHGHTEFVMGIALLAFILKIGVKAAIDTTPDATSAVRETQVGIKKFSNERKNKGILDDLMRQMADSQLPTCCDGKKLKLNYATFETIENIAPHAFTTKSGKKDHRRKFNPSVNRLTGTGSCPSCGVSRAVSIDYFIDEDGSTTPLQS